MSGGHIHHVHPMHNGRFHSSIYGGHCVCEIIATKETRPDAAVFEERRHLPSGRGAVSDVPGGRHA